MRDLKDYLSYDGITGELTWIKRPSPRKAAGDRAGSSVEKIGGTRYRRVMLHGKNHLEHRVVWYLYYGSWPKGQIDHINGDRFDNRICNLRDVSAHQNARNKQVHRNGKVWGVHQTRGKWHARFALNGQSYHVGVFQDPLLAEGAVYGFLKAKGWLEHLGFLEKS